MRKIFEIKCKKQSGEEWAGYAAVCVEEGTCLHLWELSVPRARWLRGSLQVRLAGPSLRSHEGCRAAAPGLRVKGWGCRVDRRAPLGGWAAGAAGNQPRVRGHWDGPEGPGLTGGGGGTPRGTSCCLLYSPIPAVYNPDAHFTNASFQ